MIINQFKLSGASTRYSNLCGVLFLMIFIGLSPLPVNLGVAGYIASARDSPSMGTLELKIVKIFLFFLLFLLFLLKRQQLRLFKPLVATTIIFLFGQSLIAAHNIEDLMDPIIFLIFTGICLVNIFEFNFLLSWLYILLSIHMLAGIILYIFRYDPFYTIGFGLRAGGVYGTPNSLYPLAIFCLMLSLSFIRIGIYKPFSYFGLGLSTITLILTFSRAGWIGVAIGLLLISLSVSKSHRISYIVLTLLLISGSLVIRTEGRIVSFRNDKSTTSRSHIWQAGLKIARNYSLFGAGHGAFGQSYAEDLANLPSQHNIVVVSDPKNLLLNVIIEKGILGLTALIYLHFIVISASISCTTRYRLSLSETALMYALLSTITAIIVAGLADTPILGALDRLSPTLAYLIIVGLALNIVQRRAQSVSVSETQQA